MYSDRSGFFFFLCLECTFATSHVPHVNADMHTHTHAQSQTFLSRSYSNRRGESLAEGPRARVGR